MPAAAIALADVSVILIPQLVFNPSSMLNESYPSIVFGDATLTYDTYGIPMPPPGDFGMLNAIIRVFFQDPPDGYKYVYDPTPRTATPVAPNGTIRIFKVGSAGALTEFSGAVSATTLLAMIIGQ
ncbi:MAG: hypothetical protein ABSG90_11570 [Dehalococcoidia bacterium]|jgi:hypothetical protein